MWMNMGRAVLGIGLLLSVVGRGAADDAVSIIDKAIRATAGSEARLAKRKFCIQNSHGTLMLPPGAMPATREGHQQLPTHIKWTAELGVAGQKAPFILSLDGLSGWMFVPGGRQDLSQGQYEALKDEAYFLWLASLVPLKDSAFKLTELKETKVNDQVARGVNVSSRGRPDVQLYFDSTDSLLIKGVFTVRESGLDLKRESYFSDFKEFEGFKLPTKQLVYQGGKKIEEWIIDSYRFPDRIDPSVFAKP